MKQSFWIGCALWGYKNWVGNLFPSGSRSADLLRLYAERLTAVEGNTTFYSLPSADTIARWVVETPDTFRFCPKFSKDITHSGTLVAAVPAANRFVERMQGLGDRLGVAFAQLPPHYSPAQFDDLKAFLAALPRTEARFALEVRHPAWFRSPDSERLTDLLLDLGVGRVLLDSRPIYEVAPDPQLDCERKKPNVPVQFSVTAPFSLIRYISHPDWETNLPFLQDWLLHLEQWLRQETQVYFFVHCPLEERSPTNARLIQALLEQSGVPVPALPWQQPSQPQQLKLL